MERRNFERLVGQIESVSEVLREDAKAVINRNVTARAWLTGYYIVEYEQHGQDRAKYGEGLLKALAKRLCDNSLSAESLKKNRRFYLAYPELREPITSYLFMRFGQGMSSIAELPEAMQKIGELSITQLTRQIGESPIPQSEEGEIIVWRGETPSISPWALFGRLSYTHILQFMHLDELERTFYAFEAIRGTWSVKELRRQIDSQYYIRSGWSAKPSKLSALTMEKAEKDTLRATLRSPAIIHLCHHLLHP